jgi:hypothetical protein
MERNHRVACIGCAETNHLRTRCQSSRRKFRRLSLTALPTAFRPERSTAATSTPDRIPDLVGATTHRSPERCERGGRKRPTDGSGDDPTQLIDGRRRSPTAIVGARAGAWKQGVSCMGMKTIGGRGAIAPWRIDRCHAVDGAVRRRHRPTPSTTCVGSGAPDRARSGGGAQPVHGASNGDVGRPAAAIPVFSRRCQFRPSGVVAGEVATSDSGRCARVMAGPDGRGDRLGHRPREGITDASGGGTPRHGRFDGTEKRACRPSPARGGGAAPQPGGRLGVGAAPEAGGPRREGCAWLPWHPTRQAHRQVQDEPWTRRRTPAPAISRRRLRSVRRRRRGRACRPSRPDRWA